jgi:hypothetical protein
VFISNEHAYCYSGASALRTPATRAKGHVTRPRVRTRFVVPRQARYALDDVPTRFTDHQARRSYDCYNGAGAMPTYHARGVSIRLGAMPLTETVTPTIVLRKGDLAKKQCEDAERKLLGSQLLHEERVTFPGDERGFELNWLGGAPFMQTQVGKTLFEKENAENIKRGPLALSLHVNVSDRTFISGFDKQNKLHLKIEVLFNGQLSSCLFLPTYEIRSGVKTLHQTFAGCRVDYLAERPWVILPPDVAADGSPTKGRTSILAEKRWKDISEALMMEANVRGTDKQGRVPSSAGFLQALATMEMPDQVSNMQGSGGKNFGIIDVVISAGDGRKVTSGAGYLKAPRRLKDENFPLRIALGDPESNDTKDKHVSRLNGAARNDYIPAAAAHDLVAEGESDSDYECQPKRRALMTHIRPVCFDSSSSPERGWTSQKEHDSHTGHDAFSSTAFVTPQSSYPCSSSSVDFAHTPRMRPSPYSFQFSDPVLGQDTPSALMGLLPYNDVPLLSSSSSQGSQNIHRSFPQRLTPQVPQLQPSKHDEGFNSPCTPMTFDEPPRRDSMSSTYIPSFVPSAARLWPIPPSGSQTQALSGYPSHMPNMLPSSALPGHNDSTTYGNLSLSLPYNRRLSMPLPPTAFFSVPTKPRSSLSPTKNSRPAGQKMSQPGFMLNRLIVKGKNGTTILDHRWSTAQRIAGQNCDVKSNGSPGSPTSDLADLSDAQKVTSGQRSSKVLTRAEHPSHGRKPIQVSTLDTVNQNETTKDTNGSSTRSRRSSFPEAKSAVKVDSTTTKDSTAFLDHTKTYVCDVKPAMPQRRATSGVNILGVQGPKTTTFWFEDPEEIMREAARLRRSSAPIKPENRSLAPNGATSRQVTDVLDLYATGSSSPLSSVPATPDPEEKLEAMPSTAPILEVTDSIVQVDGSPEQNMPAASSQKIAPSPKELVPISPQRLAPKIHSTYKPSPSSNTKKRKATARSLPKQPRSPDRLKTVSNPVLNQDCVIAFAESEDKDSERGVLRQVRGERQGLFAEDYVVFATRFFVAGT